MDELLSEFLTETNESLSTLDLELVKLEQNPNNPGLISMLRVRSSVFRRTASA
jgi:two-component system chemotaxis sensor kinase CheA